MDKKPLLRLISLTFVPIIALYFVPFTWWGVLLHIVGFIWILLTFRASLAPMWDEYETATAYLIQETILFAVLVNLYKFDIVNFYIYLIILFLMWLGHATMIKHVERSKK